jgi:hypothetical protein
VGGFDFRESVVLASLQDSTRGQWRQAQVLYSYPRSHKVILEAIPKDETDQARGYRGYIAVDDIQFKVEPMELSKSQTHLVDCV